MTMWKIGLGFCFGIAVSLLMLFGIQSALPINAQPGDTTSSDNLSLAQLLPDIEKIYREALITPLREAEKKIYDKDVARFFRLLMQKTELNRD